MMDCELNQICGFGENIFITFLYILGSFIFFCDGGYSLISVQHSKNKNFVQDNLYLGSAQNLYIFYWTIQ